MIANREEAANFLEDSVCDISGTDADDEKIKKEVVPKLQHNETRVAETCSAFSFYSYLSTGSDKLGAKDLLSMSSRSKHFSADQGTNLMLKACQNEGLEFIRRSVEFGIMVFLCGLLCTDPEVRRILDFWKKGASPVYTNKNLLTHAELLCQSLIVSILIFFHLHQILNYTNSAPDQIGSTRCTTLSVFDPAPFLYPPLLSILVSLILFRGKTLEFLSSIILGTSSVSQILITSNKTENLDIVHWILSMLPLLSKERYETHSFMRLSISQSDLEILVLLPPLHQSLNYITGYITEESLLPAELQLLSVSLISLLLHATSPQAIILKSLLWVGGVGILVSCSRVLKMNMALSTIPKWRFRRIKNVISSGKKFTRSKRGGSSKVTQASKILKETHSLNFSEENNVTNSQVLSSDSSSSLKSQEDLGTNQKSDSTPFTKSKSDIFNVFSTPDKKKSLGNKKHRFRSTFSSPLKFNNQVRLGKKKKKISLSEHSLSSLSLEKVIFKKKLYIGIVYFSLLATILIFVRKHIEKFALSGNEPCGWGLGYLFGDLPSFRRFITTNGLQHWIPLPVYNFEYEKHSNASWVEHWRQIYIGQANTRLIMCVYWFIILVIGLIIVLCISPKSEVDTRRKVFHFVMVAVLLPVTYVDPVFTALALSLVLSIFVLFELLRATRVPPLSKSLAHFIKPFVDSRDLKGPVVISHIFLLIGCAIPLWLTLGSLPRTGSFNMAGWDVESREVGMVSGVICVGIGDAAASLVGRRYGRRKWAWGGDKSFEGSVAFAITVGIALVLSKLWLINGGWLANNDHFYLTIWKSGIASCVASLTEAVLTGGNDNVVVPVVLWLCVKGLNL